MAIKLKVQVQETNVKLSVAAADVATFSAHEGIPIYPDTYQGQMEVTPSVETQTLETANLMMLEDITIKPIPSNYGLITWDGSTLTVS